MSVNLHPHLWFNNNVKEAVDFYCSVFPESSIKEHRVLPRTPYGDIDIIRFELWGSAIVAMNANPAFAFNQSVSFFVYCGSEERIDRLYGQLSDGGTVMMPLNKYPWSEKYAWVQDKFGISWQLDVDDIKTAHKVVPALMFANEKKAMVKEAIDHYTTLFPGSKILMEAPFPPGQNMPDGALMFAQVKLGGSFILNCMSGGPVNHAFDFNEAVSFVVLCDDQAGIDHFWNGFTANGGRESMCGWLSDRFGVSWQIVPRGLDQWLNAPDKAASARVLQAMLQMRKLDIETFGAALKG